MSGLSGPKTNRCVNTRSSASKLREVRLRPRPLTRSLAAVPGHALGPAPGVP